MTARRIDLDTWSRAEPFRFFRGFDRPHYATTARIDATDLMARRRRHGLSPYRAVLHAIGHGLHAGDAFRTRFEGDVVTRHDRIRISCTVPLDTGAFVYAYLDWTPDGAAFDAHAKTRIDAARARATLSPDSGGSDVAYASCLPWLDYTALDNAMPHRDDCIPRISWGKIVAHPDGRHDMAMTLQVHHALVDGRGVGAFFEAVQSALVAGPGDAA